MESKSPRDASAPYGMSSSTQASPLTIVCQLRSYLAEESPQIAVGPWPSCYLQNNPKASRPHTHTNLMCAELNRGKERLDASPRVMMRGMLNS